MYHTFYNVWSENRRLNKNDTFATLYKWAFKHVVLCGLKRSETEGSGTWWPRPPPVGACRPHPHGVSGCTARPGARTVTSRGFPRPARAPRPSPSRPGPVCVEAAGKGRSPQALIPQCAGSGARVGHVLAGCHRGLWTAGWSAWGVC